jgi:ABC-2 type transport system permease protein
VAAEVRLAPFGPQLLNQTMAEFRRLARVPEFSGFSLAFPVILYLFFGTQKGSVGSGIQVHTYVLASLSAYAVVNVALFSIGVTIANERGVRLDALLRASPVRPIIPLLAKVNSGVAFALVALLILYAVGILVGGVSMPAVQWFNLTWRLLLGMIPFLCMGFAFGYLAGPTAAVALINLIFLPMSFASGIFIPVSALPDFIAKFAPYLPMYHLGHFAWYSVGYPEADLGNSVLWLAGYAVLFLLIALWAVRREDDRRFS